MYRLCGVLAALFLLASCLHLAPAAPPQGLASAQSQQLLDLTRDLPVAEPAPHAPLAEQYIWTAGEVTARRADTAKYPWNRPDLRTAPQRFRAHFEVTNIPKAATLWVAGPREAHVLLMDVR